MAKQCPYCKNEYPLTEWGKHSQECTIRKQVRNNEPVIEIEVAVDPPAEDGAGDDIPPPEAPPVSQHKITPAALDLALGQDFDVDLDEIEATGSDETITIGDVRDYLAELEADQAGRDV